MLSELIDWLEEQDPSLTVPYGFGQPSSYRGYYVDCAFTPIENTTFGEMLAHAESALGATFTGWKGGEYKMDGETDCWIAEDGSTSSDMIGPTMMKLWEICAE